MYCQLKPSSNVINDKMELPENFTPWHFAVLTLTLAIPLSLLLHKLGTFGAPKSDPTTNVPSNSNAQYPTHDAAVKAVTYRVRGVPAELDRRGVLELVKSALALENGITVQVKSLSDDPSRQRAKIGTLEFSQTPVRLSQKVDKAEWEFPISDNQHGEIRLLFDTHFNGWTPLHSASDSSCNIE